MTSLQPSFVTSSPPASDDEGSGASDDEGSSSSDLGFGQLNVDIVPSDDEDEDDETGIVSDVEEDDDEGGDEDAESSDDDKVAPTRSIKPIMPFSVPAQGAPKVATKVSVANQPFMNPPPIKPSLTVQPPPIPMPKPIMKISQEPVNIAPTVYRAPNMVLNPQIKPSLPPIPSMPLTFPNPVPKPQLKMNILQPPKSALSTEEAIQASSEAKLLIPQSAKTLSEMLVKGVSETANFFNLRSNLAQRIAALNYGLQPDVIVSLSYMIANKMQYGVKYSEASENVINNILSGLASAKT